MEIRKIKRNEIPDACRLSHMVYEMAIRRNRPADEQTHKFFYEYMTETNISSCCDSGELIIWAAFDKRFMAAVCAMTKIGHITMLYVHPHFLRRRIAKKLVTKARIYAKMELGLDMVTVNAMPPETAGYFRRIGFTDINQYTAPDALFIPLSAKSIKQLEYEKKKVPAPVLLGMSLGGTGVVFICGMIYCIYNAMI